MSRSALPPVTIGLIATNVAISLAAFVSPELFEALMFQVGPVQDGQYWRLLTSGFVHADFGHLFFNMITLYFFGPVLENERVLGARNYLILYFGSLLIGGIAALIFNMSDPGYSAVGASGAISGVMMSVSMFAPFMTILIFGIIPMPAILYALLFIAFSIFGMETSIGNIGHEAHLGGALAGILITIFLRPGIGRHVVAEVRAAMQRFRK